jgi:Cu-processing system ATP-binding protein
VIRIEDVSKAYGSAEVVKHVDLEIQKGEWIGLFGHNGSGKTTLIRMLLGLTRPSSGAIMLDGELANASSWAAFRDRLGFMPERIAFHENRSGRETLVYFARLRGVDNEAANTLLEQVGLGGAEDKKVGEYSKGMRQRLNLAQALLGDPEVLVLDEPIEGLDPTGVGQFFDLVEGDGSRTVILSSHRLTEVGERVDRAGILHQGEMRMLGTVEDVRKLHNLPTRVHIYAPEANGALRGTVESLGGIALTERNGRLVAEIPQADKMAFLAGLERLGSTIDHTHIEEPNLEQAYLEIVKRDMGRRS